MIDEATVPRRFVMMRDKDFSGVSGTGLVAYGVMFSDGVVVTRWNADIAQTCVWKSMEQVEAIHGHGGATRIVWIDDDEFLDELDEGMLVGELGGDEGGGGQL